MITIFNDIAIENDWGLTNVESSGYYYSINGFIAIELMLFLGLIIAVLHWRLTIPNWIMLNVMPNYLIYSLAIPFSNLLMLIISSIPIQCLQLMVKIGFMVPFIESLAQLIAISIIFIELQLKEFMFSNYSISDSIIGSLNYSATTLHGLHVIIGSINWLITGPIYNI